MLLKSGGLNETRHIAGKRDSPTPLTCLPGTGDVFVRLAADGGAGRGEEGGALVLGAPLGLEHVDGDFVLAGEQQAREVDVVLLRRGNTLIRPPTTLTRHPGQLPPRPSG